MAASSHKRAPLTAVTKATVTPPTINRQHSHSKPDRTSPRDATTVLANVASRTTSPRRGSAEGSVSSSPRDSPVDCPKMERRVSWEECTQQRDGYISFPDFDQLKKEGKEYGATTSQAT